MRTINTSDLRSNIANVLNSVYLDNEVYEVKRGGLAVAHITKPKKIKTKSSIMDFAGILQDLPINTDEWINNIRESRKSKGKLKRKLPRL